ncbi:Uncharacterized protein YyaL [Candidatus Protochlamydia amoebophila]|uniref:Uncharacterized protein YyaL n=1 Tax=Candidatus Protochlamydia amoebophila TaxID=362787 RepID=A0A0C1JJH5_9BACT|nr:Uncharacterized protein YyaL [Candidatus Protochlamydia amoebophila]
MLHTPLNLEEFASKHQQDIDQLKIMFDNQRKKLWSAREKRIHPLKDDKILSSWNGLMIYSFAEAAFTFDCPLYLEAAVKAARFIKNNLWKNQKLLRRWREGQAMFQAGLDEYAFMIKGALSLFEANAGTEWLEWAIEMATLLKNQYKAEEGAFYQTDGGDKNLLLRKCQFSDGAEPSGNAVHCENLLRLYQLTNEEDYLVQAEDIFKGVKEYLENYAPGYCYHVMNLLRYYDDTSPTIVIALNSKREHEQAIKQLLYQNFIPHKAIIWQTQVLQLEEIIPYVKEQEARDDQTTLYICYEGACQQPIIDLKQMREAIEKL